MAKFRICLLLFIVIGIFEKTTAKPDGAPESSCKTMRPEHNVNAQTSKSPFTTVPLTQTVSRDTPITVTLQSNESQVFFKGFLLIAFDNPNSNTPIGTFVSNSSNVKIIKCENTTSPQNAATHTGRDDKSSVKVQWRPPNGYSGKVYFRTTYVKNRETFWMVSSSSSKIQSSVIILLFLYCFPLFSVFTV